MIEAYEGSLAVITGASDGIGRALVEGLLGLGIRVAAIDVDEKGLGNLLERTGSDLVGTFCCDVCDISQMEATHKKILREMGEVSLVWVNAGVGIGGSILSARKENLQWLYEVNVLGAINTVRTFVPDLLDQAGPRHVGFTASSACLRQISGPSTAYAASKFAFWGVAESVRSDLAETDVGVSILFPSLTNTKIWDSARVRPEKFGGARSAHPKAGERWKTGLSVAEVARRALNSVSGETPYVIVPTSGTQSDFESYTSLLMKGFDDANTN